MMDRLLAFLYRLPTSLADRLRRLVWSRLLNTRIMCLGGQCQILGRRHLQIGTAFRAGRMLWLEAVEQYGHQSFQPRLSIGERVSCSDSVHIACAFEVHIGNDVLMGSKVHVTDHNHGRYQGEEPHSSPFDRPSARELHGAPVHIGNRVFLADNVVVLPGSRIGDGVVVGANAVVRGMLPDNTLCVGAPARPLKRFDQTSMSWIPF